MQLAEHTEPMKKGGCVVKKALKVLLALLALVIAGGSNAGWA